MVKRVLVFLCIFSLLISPLSTNSTQAKEGTETNPPTEAAFASGQLIIKLRPEAKVETNTLSTHVSSLDKALASVNAIALTPLKGLPGTYILKMQAKANILNAVETLNKEPAVEYAEPDYLAQFASVPDDPRYTEQWGLSKIAVEGAWDQSMGSPTIVIAIIDSGIDLAHEDLAPNLWVNPGEIPGNGLDDDNNTFIDDVQGWNFVDSTNIVQDYIGHGSLVSGVAAARINNTVGIAGVCGNCHIMPVKVSQISGFANYSDIAAGVAYATQKGARVINISLGGYANSTTLRNAITTAVSQNIVVVAGAGNDNTSNLFYPAAYENVIAVAGTDQNDVKTTSSNFGTWVDVSAPGQDILSTTLGDYSSDSGTSYAAPFVSGAAGLLLSMHPEWTPAMIRGQFSHTSDNIDSLNPGFEGLLGSGRLNATMALQPPQPILTYKSYSGNGVANFRPDFGSTVDLTVSLFNDWSDAVGVTGTLSSTDSYVAVTTPSADFGSILAGETKANLIPFSFDIASGAGYNHVMLFELGLSSNDGTYTTTLNFSLATRSSEEPVSGTIDTDTTWTNDKAYKVTGNVGLAPGFTLTIEPGTTIKFAGNYSLNIGGTLIAQGTAEQPIRFEPYTAGSTWNRIFFDDTSVDAQTTAEGSYVSGNVLQHVELMGPSAGIGCTTATPFVDNVTTDLGGITCSLGTTDLWLSNSYLMGTINISQGGTTPENLTNVHVNNGNATLPACSVTESSFTGSLTIQGNGQVSNSLVGSLSVTGVGDAQQVTSNAGISIASGQVLDSEAKHGSISAGAGSVISDCLVNGGGINSGSGSTITGNNVENATGIGINTNGSSSVTFNRVVSAVQGIIASAGWVENNLVSETTGDGLHPGTASIRSNTFIGIEGNAIYLDNVPSAFEYNNFEFNTGTYDVYVTVPKATIINLVAQNNWWGTTDSNLIKERTWDYVDDYTLARLITAPVLTTPSQTAPAYVRSVTLDPESPVGIQTVNFTVEFSRPMESGVNPELSFSDSQGDYWHTVTPEEGLCGTHIRHIISDDLGYVWIATYNGGSCKRLLDGSIISLGGGGEYILPDNTGGAWINRWSSLGYIDAAGTESNISLPLALQGHNLRGLMRDHYGNLWVGSEGYAAASVDQSGSWTVYDSSNSPLNNTVTAAILDNQDNLWLSVAQTGLYKRTPQGEWILYSPSNSSFLCADDQNGDGFVDSEGNLWFVCGSHGVTEITNDGRWVNYTSFGQVRRIFEDIEGDIWFGVGGGAVELLENGEWNTFSGQPGLYDVHGIGFPSENEIWFGSYWGYGVSVLHIAPVYLVEQSPTWIDSMHFQASYDFTTLVPRGEYLLKTQGGVGLDGLLVVPHQGENFQVDYAGEISDTTPPLAPTVSAWGNGSLSQLSAQASADDPDSDIVGYRYAIGSTPGASDVVNWTNTPFTTVSRTSLLLLPDQPYYVSFQARNLGGLWSPVGVSNAVINGVPLEHQAPLSNAGLDQSVDTSSLVTLDGSGSSDPDGDLPLTFQWTQVGGTVVVLSDSTAVRPTFTAPSDPEEMTFSLIVTDSLGFASVADEVVITINNQAPVADAGPDQSVDTSTLVTLDGSESGDPDGDLPLTYQWEQVGGTVVVLSDPNSVNPTFTAPSDPDELIFSLVVTDSLGFASESDEVVITVNNQAPLANAGPDQSVDTSSLVTLDGSGSSDPDGDVPLTYQWIQTSGMTVVLSDPHAISPTFTAHPFPDQPTFSLIVTDSLGLSSVEDEVVITVNNQAPVANAGPDQSVDTLSLVTLDGSGSSDPDGHTPLSYQWTQVSGTTVVLSDPTSVNPTFTAPSDPDILTFSLVVTDVLGLSSVADEVFITVNNQAPESDADQDQSVDTMFLVTLEGSESSDPDGDLPLTFQWTQVGGTGVVLSDPTSVTPTFTAPADPDELTFSLVVTDSLGFASVADEVVITVNNQAPESDAGPDQFVDPSSLVYLDGSGSSDPDDDLPLTFQWTQISGAEVVIDDPTSATPSFVAPSDTGTLTFTLIVTDNLGMESELDLVEIFVNAFKIYLPMIIK